MVDLSITSKLYPEAIVQSALATAQGRFARLYADTQLLLVRIETGGDLAEGLVASAADAGAPLKPSVPLQFQTELVASSAQAQRASRAKSASELGAETLRARFLEAAHFIVPLRKRPAVDAVSADRISVGRARNTDVVLRHVSVSKFHGWFQLDDGGSFCLTDAGSKNGTRVNGAALEPRKIERLYAGDRIQFGSVDTLLCPADAFWAALRARGPG